MSYRADDSISSANTPSFDSYKNESKDYSIYRCLVIASKYVDDDSNPTKGSPIPEMVYDCQVIGGYIEGQILSNVRAVSQAGGNNNFSERVYKASNKNQKDVGLSVQDGDIVYVGFVAGDRESAIILGGGNHVLDLDSTGAKRSEGPRLRDQYNGIFTEIDKDGNYTWKRLGGKYNSKTGEFEPDAEGKRIIIEYSDNSITTSLNDGAIKEVVNGDDETITRTYKSGMVVVEDGKGDKVTTTTKSGTEMIIDGSNEKITLKAGSTVLEIDGKTGKIALKGDLVDLGSSVSDFAVLYTKLAAAYNSHTHPFMDNTPPGPPIPKVTSPPSSPMPANVKSNTVKVQS